MTFRIVVASVAMVLGVSAAHAFELSSPDIAAGGTVPPRQIYNGQGCTGGNVSPALAWREAPSGARSFAVTVFDPDAPTGNGWWHWAIFDIPAGVTKLDASSGNLRVARAPKGAVQGVNDFREPGYSGPCPPRGDKPHRYVFTVYALGADRLPFDSGATDRAVGRYLHAHALGKASLTARYGR